jgi:hypothetical protein
MSVFPADRKMYAGDKDWQLINAAVMISTAFGLLSFFLFVKISWRLAEIPSLLYGQPNLYIAAAYSPAEVP